MGRLRTLASILAPAWGLAAPGAHASGPVVEVPSAPPAGGAEVRPAPSGAAPASQGAAPAPGAPGAGAEAWRTARWGMSVEEVLAAFPGEATRVQPEVRLEDGNVIGAGIERHEFESLEFRVRFIFTGGRLALVSLRTPQARYVDATEYERLQGALAARWGPAAEVARDDNFIDLRQTRWDRGPTRVDLKYIPGVVVVLFAAAGEGPASVPSPVAPSPGAGSAPAPKP